MFCEHCGFSLDENAKFCPNCGIYTFGESTQPVVTTNVTEEAWTSEVHWEYFWSYFTKGLIGFGIGAVFAIAGENPEGFLYLGLLFAGVPYGWNLISRITNGWTVYGIVVIGLYYIFKLISSLLIAITVYPPLLFYHLMMSQKPKSTAKTICIVFFVLSIIASFLVVYGLLVK